MGAEPQRGPLGQLGPQDVAGRDWGDVEALGQKVRLRALTTGWRSQEQQIPTRLSCRAFLWEWLAELMQGSWHLGSLLAK
jgi:hypothetical protein